MRALRDIITAPYARHVVAEYTAAGSYSITLAPGKYHLTIIGGGGGAATAGYKTATESSSIGGNWGYATGGGGGMVYGDIVVSETAAMSIVVGAGSAGSAMSAVYDSVTSAFASVGPGEDSSVSFGGNTVAAEGGNSTTYAAAAMSNVGAMTVRPGNGGGLSQYITGFLWYNGEDGTIPSAKITEFSDGTSGIFHGGTAGNGNVPSELGDAGNGGDVTWGYADGVLVFNGGNGHDGAVLIEKIG